MEQRADTVLRQRTLFAAVLFASFQVMLACLSSSSTDLLQVFTGLSTFLLPRRFHSRACLEVQGLLNKKVFVVDWREAQVLSMWTEMQTVAYAMLGNLKGLSHG